MEETSAQGLDNNSEMMNQARQRSTVYGLLALVFRQEATASLVREIRTPELLEALQGLELRFDDDFLSTPIDELVEDLSTEYARLFLGPGKHISPHESIHHERDDGQWGQLWGASTVEVKKFIEATGIGYDPEYKGLPDHISVELEFMSDLIAHEEMLWSEKRLDEAEKCREVEKRFLEEHLFTWAASFCRKVKEEAESSFYREMASLTEHFIEIEVSSYRP